MNLLVKDEIGVPSTFVAILVNVFQAVGIDMVNVFFTTMISILSIIYLILKIKNEKSILDKRKEDEKKD
jgi:hypothetical protein